MASTNEVQREVVQDIWYGQIVAITARWFLIGSALFLTLWRAEQIGDTTATLYLLLGLIGLNFFAHGRYLTGSPLRRELVVAFAILDVAVISLVILTTQWRAAAGVENPFYIFYYAELLAFALIFPRQITVPFTAVVIGSYLTIIFIATPDFAIGDHYEAIVARVVTMASVAALGNVYWRIQRDWLRRLPAAAS